MSEDLQELERLLLVSPFELELRARYAAGLCAAGRLEASLGQWQLLIQQAEGRASFHLGAALCTHGLGRLEEARVGLMKARSCSDFDASDPRVAELEAAKKVPAATGLRAIRGGLDDQRTNVISLAVTDQVRFADVVGMAELKRLIRLRIIDPFVNPGLFARFKKRSGGGVLLYGPPGCGKTMIARAIATECRASFTPIGISDILNMWMGESERNLAAIFDKARAGAPSVLFFDELDALAFSRSKARSDHTRTLVNEFLNQLDGMSGRNDKVLVLAATNMPWDVDDAMKRPGRFNRQVFVPPPDAEARSEMLRVKLADVPHSAFDERAVASICPHFSGADIDGVVEEAKDAVLSDIMDGRHERQIGQEDLVRAASQAQASTLEWLKTARNLVKFGGAGSAYKDVEQYLKAHGLY